ncbi:class I SAM-dependent methyltransferase [Gymnodinialimonas sp. 57CJ19]|uniref:class I SAM-dependent methyltransferase n=1 Tax=Gymnodinialimonas sp. 57CJ19 TaxID=3138498 RepID=UPI0031346291
MGKCHDCDLVYLLNPPGYEALVEDFAWERTWAAEATARLEARPFLQRADLATRWRHKIGRKPEAVRYAEWFGAGNLLNVGCSGASAQYPGFTQFGIEISAELAGQANENLTPHGGYCIHGPGALAIREFPDGMFEGVILRSYLEHEEHPRPVLEHVARILKPGGRAYVRVPNFGSLGKRLFGRNWVGLRYPDHVQYYTVATLRALAERTGFSMRLLNPVRLPLDDNINVLFERAEA